MGMCTDIKLCVFYWANSSNFEVPRDTRLYGVGLVLVVAVARSVLICGRMFLTKM